MHTTMLFLYAISNFIWKYAYFCPKAEVVGKSGCVHISVFYLVYCVHCGRFIRFHFISHNSRYNLRENVIGLPYIIYDCSYIDNLEMKAH